MNALYPLENKARNKPKLISKKPAKRKTKFTKIKFSPYRKKENSPNESLLKKSESIMENHQTYAIPKNNAFPIRKFSISAGFIKKYIGRSHSCVTENISLLEIEKIERLQKLVNFQPFVPKSFNNKNQTHRLASSFYNSFVISFPTNRLNYKRYIKRK